MCWFWRNLSTRRVETMYFRRNRAVKFNSGQYMNDTLEGAPRAPFYRAAFLTGRPFFGNIRYVIHMIHVTSKPSGLVWYIASCKACLNLDLDLSEVCNALLR